MAEGVIGCCFGWPVIGSCSRAASQHDAGASGETTMPLVSQPQYKAKHMGDKSPKATQKKSTQKQTKVSSADLKKKQAAAAKPAAKKK